MNSALKCLKFIIFFGQQAKKNGFNGPVIGVKVADENKRDFSKEKLELGKTIIGMQSGTLHSTFVLLSTLQNLLYLLNVKLLR